MDLGTTVITCLSATPSRNHQGSIPIQNSLRTSKHKYQLRKQPVSLAEYICPIWLCNKVL